MTVKPVPCQHPNGSLDEIGLSLDDLVKWGGEVRYDHGMPATPGNINPLGAVQREEIVAILDEAVRSWSDTAPEMDMRFLPLDEPLVRRLEALGYRRATLLKNKHPKLPADVKMLDFSGWTIFTCGDVPDNLFTLFCTALEARKESIPWEGAGPMALDRMGRDTPEGPLDIPLHPAAERFWREKGYLA